MEVILMNHLTWLDWVAIILLVVGGLNWGIVGIFGFNIINAIFTSMEVVARIIYVLVGIAAVYVAVVSVNYARK